MTFPLQVPYVC